MGDEEVKYLPMDIQAYPRKENVIGQSREFIDNFEREYK